MSDSPLAGINTIIHVGPPNGSDPREFKREGKRLVWILTEEERKSHDALLDEVVMVWQSDRQLTRLMHDAMELWKGAQVIGDQSKFERIATIMHHLVELHNFEVHSAGVLTKDRLPTRNALRNFRWIEDGLSLKRVRGKGKGSFAFIIAAGPSLNKQWGLLRALRKARKDCPFIIVGRSYKKAMLEGVWPDFVVEVEQYDWDAEIFTFAPPPPSPDTVLAFTLSTTPKVPRLWPSQKLVLVDHNTAELFQPEMKLHEDSVDGGNSVLHHCFNVASILECDKVYIAGADLGYPMGTAEDTHAEGTFHAWPTDVVKAEHSHQEPVTLEGNDGKPLLSSGPYRNFGVLLSIMIDRAKKKLPALEVYSFSERGLKVDGVSYVDLKEFLCSQLKPPPSGSSPPSSSPSASSSTGGSPPVTGTDPAKPT